MSAATSFISHLEGWEIGDSQEHLGLAHPGMLGLSPSRSGGLSRGPTPLWDHFCESNVITDGNGAFSFDLALRGAGGFIRFPRHQAGSRMLGCYFFSLLFLTQVESKSGPESLLLRGRAGLEWANPILGFLPPLCLHSSWSLCLDTFSSPCYPLSLLALRSP